MKEVNQKIAFLFFAGPMFPVAFFRLKTGNVQPHMVQMHKETAWIAAKWPYIPAAPPGLLCKESKE